MKTGYATWSTDKTLGLNGIYASLREIRFGVQSKDDAYVIAELNKIRKTFKLIATSAWEITHKMIVKMELALKEIKELLAESKNPVKQKIYAAESATAIKNGSKMIDKIGSQFKNITKYLKKAIAKIKNNNAGKYDAQLDALLKNINNPTKLVAEGNMVKPVSVDKQGNIENLVDDQKPIEPKVEQSVQPVVQDANVEKIIGSTQDSKPEFVEVKPADLPNKIDTKETVKIISKVQQNLAEFDSNSKVIISSGGGIDTAEDISNKMVKGFSKGIKIISKGLKTGWKAVTDFFENLFDV